MEKRKGIFYGWWIVISCFLIMSLVYSPVINLVSLYTKPVSESLGIGRSEFNMYYTIMAAVSMVSCPLFGKLMKKFDIRALVSVCILLVIGAYIGFSFSNKLIYFYILSVPIGVGVTGAAIIPISALITNWFNEKRGLCLGLVLSGSGFGGIILSPITNWIITNYGWRSSYFVTAILMLIVTIPFSVFVIRLNPSDKGLEPLGGELIVSLNQKETSGLSYSETLKTASFWILCLAITISGVIINSTGVILSTYLTDIGYTSQNASLILSLSLGTVIFGKILVGKLCDAKGIKLSLTVICVSILGAMLALKGASVLMVGIIYTIFTGVGSTSVTVAPSYITAGLFGDKEYSSKFGVVAIFGSLGAALSPIISGTIYNINHSYSLLLNVLVVLSVACFVLFMIAIKIKPQEKEIVMKICEEKGM